MTYLSSRMFLIASEGTHFLLEIIILILGKRDKIQIIKIRVMTDT